MRYTVKVTEELINTCGHETNNCPIAIALKTDGGFTYVYVDGHTVKVETRTGLKYRAYTSRKAGHFITKFDNLKPVKPDIFRFDFSEYF